MTVNHSQMNGVIRIEQRVNGILYKRTYIDYSEKQAKIEFKKYLKSCKN